MRILVLSDIQANWPALQVARSQARTRQEMSAAHTDEQIDHAIGAFVAAGREVGVLRG